MNLAANLRDQIRHSIPAVIVVVIGAWVMIYYSIVQWETMKQVPSWDLAIFSEMAKAYAHLQAPIVPVKGDGFNLLGDHFHPILILLGPIWRLFPTPLSLLITQDLLLAVSAWPLTRLASRLTNQWVGPWASSTSCPGECREPWPRSSTRSPSPCRCWPTPRSPSWSGAGWR